MNLNQLKRKAIKLFSLMAVFILALVIPMGIKLLPVEASTTNLDSLEVGDTFSGTLGTSNTNPSTGVTNFTIDYIDGLLGSASGQIINQLSVQCLEPGHIGLTYKTAYESGSKTYYPYNATVTDVQPDGRVTLRIDVPRYLNPYTGLEATGWSAGLGTVPYQRCGATWVIQTAPRNITVNVTLDKSNGNPTMTQGNAACYAQDLSGAIYAVYSDAGLTNEIGRIMTDTNGHGELNGITVQRNAVLYTKELVAPRGFNLDSQVYRHVFTANGETYNVQSTDQPMNDPLQITLNKVSADGNAVANPASLEGAEFTLKFYAGQYTFNDLPATATRTWVVKTKFVGGSFYTRLGDEYKVSGDPFYLDAGIPTLPLGTLTVEETKAPAGYTLDNKVIDATNSPAPNIRNGVVLFNIVDDNSTARVVGGNAYTVVEGVVRGGLEIQKKDADTGANVGTATFEIVNKNNYDVVARDENGDVVATAAAGQTLPYTITTDEHGYWKSNDAFLPAGDYELVEVSAPAGYYLNTNPKPFEIKDNGATVSLDYADDKIVIDVVKTDGKGNNVAGAKMTLIDKVTGSEIVTFTSTKENTDISKFVEGGKTYILREDEAPFGFNKFEDIEFTVTGTRQHEQVVMAVDTRKVFYVSAIKVDAMDSSKKLKGAELTLFKADGTVAVDKDGNPCVGITDGEGVITWTVEYADDLGGYYVQETAAPEGYRINNEHFQVVLSEDCDFAVNNAVKVVVNDMALPAIVKTGDTFNAVGLSMMFVGGLAAALFLFLKKKELVK